MARVLFSLSRDVAVLAAVLASATFDSVCGASPRTCAGRGWVTKTFVSVSMTSSRQFAELSNVAEIAEVRAMRTD
jgi:hypothetical protein